MNTVSKKHDVPQCLKPVRLSRYAGIELEAEFKNGDSIRYGSFEAGTCDPGPQWYEVTYATGSDYSGGTVERSNHGELVKMLQTMAKRRKRLCWLDCHGGHGTYSLYVVWDRLSMRVKETLNALDDYCLVSEDAHSALECELESEAWESNGCRDWLRWIRKDNGLDELELSNDDLWTLYDLAANMGTGERAQFETGCLVYFDWDRFGKNLNAALADGYEYATDEQIAALERLRLALETEHQKEASNG